MKWKITRKEQGFVYPKERFKLLSIFCFSLGLTSCASNALTVSDYRNQIQCINSAVPSAKVVTAQQVANSALTISLEPSTNANDEAKLGEHFWFVKVAMGQKSTAGYSLSLITDQLDISNNTVEVALKWNEPKPGSFSAQVLTAPCIYLKLEKGEYNQVRILDETMTEKFVVNTPN